MRISDWSSDVCSSDLVTDGGAFVDDLDAVRLELREMIGGALPGGFDHANPAVDQRGAIFGVRRRRQRREDGEIHPERLTRDVARQDDLTREGLRRRLG